MLKVLCLSDPKQESAFLATKDLMVVIAATHELDSVPQDLLTKTTPVETKLHLPQTTEADISKLWDTFWCSDMAMLKS